MNHLSIFLNTRIKDSRFNLANLFSGIGNFFLAPYRFVFGGKTIVIDDQNPNLSIRDRNIAKVSSFYNATPEYEDGPIPKKFSKQLPALESTGWGIGPDIIIVPIFQLVFLVPCTIIGSIFKGLSYLSPTIREAHHTVKKKLTPDDLEIGKENELIPNEDTLQQNLRARLQSGQKTNTLIIHAQNKTLSKTSLTLIKNINPLKLILMGHLWKKEGDYKIEKVISSEGNKNKWTKWDFTALQVPPHKKCKSDYDYASTVGEAKIVPTIDDARHDSSLLKHTIYIVSNDKKSDVEPSAKPSGRIVQI